MHILFSRIRRQMRCTRLRGAPSLGGRHSAIDLFFQLRLESFRSKGPALAGRGPEQIDFGRGKSLFHQGLVNGFTIERSVSQGPVKGMVGNHRIRLDTRMMNITRPSIMLRVSSQSGTRRFGLDVPATRQEVLRRLDHGCTVASLPQRSRPSVFGIEIRDILPANPLHHASESISVRR